MGFIGCLGLMIQVLGFRLVSGSMGFRVQGFWFRVFGVWGSMGCRYRVLVSSVCAVLGL